MITLTLPLPPPALSPNARPRHWSIKTRAVAAYRSRAEMEARRLPRRQRQAWDRAEIQITFYHPNRRRRDADNALASMKAGLDGLVRAGVLSDDHGVTYPPVRFVVDRDQRPRVEIQIRPLPAEGEAA